MARPEAPPSVPEQHSVDLGLVTDHEILLSIAVEISGVYGIRMQIAEQEGLRRPETSTTVAQQEGEGVAAPATLSQVIGYGDISRSIAIEVGDRNAKDRMSSGKGTRGIECCCPR
jgi:hypothetical protein